jgi:hypothetical protein
MTLPSMIVAPRSTLMAPTLGGTNVRNDGTVAGGVQVAGGVIAALAAVEAATATRPAAAVAESFRRPMLSR